MTSLLGAKKRAEEFSAAVEGRTPASGLRPELAELVGVVSALRSHDAPAPRPEFSAGLRDRLLAEAETTLATDSVLRLPPRRSGSRERRLALVASSVVLVGGSAGLAAASQNALPGEALYPVKRGIERVQADFGTDPAGKGRELLTQADNRLVEAEELLEADETVHVPGTIERFTMQAGEGAQLLLESFEESRDPALVEEVRSFTGASLPVLQELAEVAPADAQDELADAAAALLDIDRRAGEACTTCLPELPALQMPELFLTAAEVERALEPIVETTGGDTRPEAGGTTRERPGEGEQPGTSGRPADGQPQLPPPPGAPGLPGMPEGADINAPRDLGDVVDGVGGAAGGLLDSVGETVEELVPEEPEPLTGPLKDKVKDTVKDPVKELIDPLEGITDPLKGPTDPTTKSSGDSLLP